MSDKHPFMLQKLLFVKLTGTSVNVPNKHHMETFKILRIVGILKNVDFLCKYYVLVNKLLPQ